MRNLMIVSFLVLIFSLGMTFSESAAEPFIGAYLQPSVKGYRGGTYYNSLSGTGYGGSIGFNLNNTLLLEGGYDISTFDEKLCTDRQNLYQENKTFFFGIRLYLIKKILGFNVGIAHQNKTRRLFWKETGEEIFGFSYDFESEMTGYYYGPSIQIPFPGPLKPLAVYIDYTFRPKQYTTHAQVGFRLTF